MRRILDDIRAAHARLAQSLPSHRGYIEMLNRGDAARRELEPAPPPGSAATGGIG
ncbi:hypothetical protein D3C83_290260 [compost metagenome]